ncbi:MAG: hypothetical protein ABR964_09280 [Tepidisphaeraceae bacterium]|jgi:subtilase family serine protease
MFSTNKRAAKIRRFACHPHVEPLEGRVLLSVSGTPQQLSPAMIEQAYDLKNIVFTTGGKTVSANGAGETIAIVDAFGDPNIASDLQTFDANFGISNDNASGQFVLSVATPQGGVATDGGWASEESLDVEWAHAIAPEANILLVEAPSTSVTALTDAVAWAASQTGVVAISMSWGSTPEFAGETAYDHNFTTPSSHPGITFVAASGDDAQPNYPSTSVNVLGVGGTTLTVDASGNFISESAWSGSGGGTSPYEGTSKPDVAYDADPNTGFLVYDSIPYQGNSGWQVAGGTSAGAPQWAALIALADQGRSLLALGSLDGPTQTISDLYNLPSSDFNQVSGGGLTGLGSPNAEKIISSLVGGGITSVSPSPSANSVQLAFIQQPMNVTAGSAITPAVTVDVEDSDGHVVTSDDSSVTLSVHSGSGSLSGTTTVAAVNGVATFSNVDITTAGNYTLTASDDGLSTATSNSFTISPAAAAKVVYVQQPTNTAAGSSISPAVTVDVEDPYGNLVATDSSSVTLSVQSGPGSLSGTLIVAASGGVATFSGLSSDTAGNYTLTAADGSLTSATSNSFTISPASAAKVAFAQQPTNTTDGSTISPAVTVDVEDPYGNLVTTDNSSVTVSLQSGPGNLGGTLTVATSGGVATFNDLSITTVGNYTLTAADGGLTSATSNSFTISPAPAAKVAFAQQPTNTAAGSAITPAVTVDVEDSHGNIVTSDDSSVTLSVHNGSGSLSGTTTVAAVNGVATFSNVDITTAGNYTLTASDGSLISATSSSFAISHLAASQLSIAVQQATAPEFGMVSPYVSLAVADPYGNPVTDDASSITASIVSGPAGARILGTSTVPVINGYATFNNLILSLPGDYSLLFTDGDLITATSGTFRVFNIPLNERWWFGSMPLSVSVIATPADQPIAAGSTASASPSASASFVASGLASPRDPAAVATALSTQATDALATSNNLLD